MSSSVVAAPVPSLVDGAGAATRRRRPVGRRRWGQLIWVAPALAVYAFFVLRPLITSVQYSLYEWNGIGVATFVGGANYVEVLTDPEQLGIIANAVVLVLFFTVIPVALGLLAAALMHGLPSGSFTTVSRSVLFIPQVIPLVAAGIVWDWVYSTNGIANQLLSAVGLGGITRPWLADFDTALPAVGLIGSWVQLGLCTLLLLTGIAKIDPSLYEAARLDGASRLQVFRHVTLPGLRREIGVCVTVTMIAALASFDIVYITTQGGPGNQTMVPGVEIYRLAFSEREVGQASAMAVVLMVLVLVAILPVQRLTQRSDQ
ncbi:carbohydrate ABC transporter permease [Klenkia taihuensis]|uniref:Carbohydrate ABC transporter membrane protein 1, CUT1 family (TC 3.A.1.1.-) n=1 Tax=Klenkia taihuensis TaxID=1225127 RepID=A0A1I1GEA7_9ACTN|nr:sugar ABC transporter permease [Klenkia taihuensis]GHE09921.1 ABC transporter permease [Klenkia taihuensis]SFC07460.1 carbohydrate ABC transporter membrane protein 1, CUT1 family (TC 3.A.1.1.-) [Klenkia taihuensis]